MTEALSWIFLRGLTREARHWSRFTAQFAAYLAPIHVVTLDLLGNGECHLQTSPLSAGGIVAFARQRLLAQGLKPPYALLAMSLGGMVATSWAQRYPDEISRLVLINTSMRPFSNITQRLRPGQWLPMLALATRWRDADYAEHSIHRITCNQAAQRDADLLVWQHIRRSAPVSSANALRQLIAAARFACAPQTPRCRALVLSSKGDQLVNPLCSIQLAAAWQVEHHIHPWAGHDLPHDDSVWVCEQVAKWNLLLNQ